MASTAVSGARKAAVFAAGAVGLGFASYYLTQAGAVRSLERKHEDLETAVSG